MDDNIKRHIKDILVQTWVLTFKTKTSGNTVTLYQTISFYNYISIILLKVCLTASFDIWLPNGKIFLSILILLKQEVIILDGVEFQCILIFRQFFYYFPLHAIFSHHEDLQKYLMKWIIHIWMFEILKIDKTNSETLFVMYVLCKL